MKIVSTNIAQQRIVKWRGKNVKTGIYKTPIDKPFFLGKEEVKGDEISDRKNHGGQYKACYLFAKEEYHYWKDLYPDLEWGFGMFGENLTIEGFDEKKIMVGAIYELGDAVIQITQPREPCFKFGIKFGTQKVLRQFIDHGFSGTYASVLKEGNVAKGDSLILREQSTIPVSVWDFFQLLYSQDKNQDHLRILINSDFIAEKKRIDLARSYRNF